MFTTTMIRTILTNRAEYIKSIKKRKRKSYIRHLAEKEAKMHNLDFTMHKFPISNYLIFCNFCDWFYQTSFFSNYMLFMIIIAALMVGLTTYDEFNNNIYIDGIQAIVFYSFLSEICLKILSEGLAPQLFFINSEWKWNWFDTLIVLFSFPQFPIAAGDVKLLRLVRLARIGKILKKFPALLMIFRGLVGGLKSCSYILILMGILNYMFAVAGVLFFRESDPFHFQTFEVVFCNLFRIATLDNWGDILYINYYGCDVYNAGIYCTDCDVGGSPPLECKNPSAQPVLITLYTIVYIFALGFCVLSLFIGTVTVAMSESIITMKEEDTKRKIEEEKKIMGERAKEFEDITKLDRKNKRKAKLIQLAFHGFVLKEEALAQESKVDYYSISSIYSYLAELAHEFVTSTVFSSAMLGTILLAGITIGLQTDSKVDSMYNPYSDTIDVFIQAMFVAEVGLKIISEDKKPLRYFNDGWNIFDFLVVAISFVNTGNQSLVTMLRLLRLLRVLKLLKALPQLQTILSALISGTKSIVLISIVLVLYIYVYAILGQILFQQADPHHFGRLHYAMMVLFQQTTFDGWSALMYIGQYGCDKGGYNTYGDFEGECTHPQNNFGIASTYWILHVIIGGMVLVSLFIGVVAIGMEETDNQEKKDAMLLKKTAKIADKEHLTEDEIKLYKEVFDTVDFASGGSIGQQEMLLGLKIAGMNLDEADFLKLWNKLDNDGSGNIEFAEFLQFMLYLKKLIGQGHGDHDSELLADALHGHKDADAVPEPLPDKAATPLPRKPALKRWGKLRLSLAAIQAMRISDNSIVPVEGDEQEEEKDSTRVDNTTVITEQPVTPQVKKVVCVEMEVQTDLQIPINDDNINSLEPYQQYFLIASKKNEKLNDDLMNTAIFKEQEEDINLFEQEHAVVDNSTDECIATVDNMKLMAENSKKEERMKQHPHSIIAEVLLKHQDTTGGVGTEVSNVTPIRGTNVTTYQSSNTDDNNDNDNNNDSGDDEDDVPNTIGNMISQAFNFGKRSPHRNRPSLTMQTMQLIDRVPNTRRRIKPS